MEPYEREELSLEELGVDTRPFDLLELPDPDVAQPLTGLRALEARQEVLRALLERLDERARDLARGAADLCQELDEVAAQLEERRRALAKKEAGRARPVAPRRRRRAW